MAMYRIKPATNDPPEPPPREYWREIPPDGAQDLDPEVFAELNQLPEDDELSPVRPFRSRLLLGLLAGVVLAAFCLWSAWSLFPRRLDFSFLIHSAALSQDESLAALRDAVVVIEASGGGGSGFNIRPDGLIVTNAHVVEKGGLISVRFPQTAGGQTFVCREYQTIPQVDLAVLDIDGEALPYVECSEETVQPGDPVIFIGNPLGYDWTISQGEIIRETALDGETVIWFRGPVHPGSSGSPMFNDKAQVVAVVFALLGEETDQQGLAIPISYLTSIPIQKETTEHDDKALALQR